MIELQNFLEEDFDRLISWIKNEEEMVQFAGPIFIYPVTHEQLRAYNSQSVKQAFKVILSSTGEIIGHCELNFQNPIPRLSRILIGDKFFRNKGFGKAIVRKMLNRVFMTTDFEHVDLSVFDWNKNAIASYRSVGFTINEGFETQMEVNGKIWTAFNMIISKQDYYKNK
jgi:RimJ/RimL family protein N-acetyltransferase